MKKPISNSIEARVAPAVVVAHLCCSAIFMKKIIIALVVCVSAMLSEGAAAAAAIPPPHGLPVVDSKLDKLPKPVEMAKPVYPFELRRKKISGVVVVEYVVGPKGNVASTKVLESPDKGLSRAAENAIRKWKFEPAEKGGQKVECTLRVPITFSLGQ